MRLQTPENANYAAIVVKLTAITPLEGSDNIVGTPIFGFQAIVGKSSQVGDIGIVFPAETQLNDEFCRENNLSSGWAIPHQTSKTSLLLKGIYA